MSWVTTIWTMVASACLTLAVIYFLVWWSNRTTSANLLFAMTAASTAAFTLCELRQLRAGTSEELLAAMRWTHVALLCLLVSTVWFVTLYLGAGRRWLAWTVSGLRAFYLLVAFLIWGNVNYLEITSLGRMPFLGDSVTVFTGIPNLWMRFGYATMLLILIFVADASVTAWRRGERRKALTIGGSVEFFLLLGTFEAALVHWAQLPIPVLIAPLYLGLIVVMGYEVSRDVIRASQLVDDLRSTEAGLRENQAMLQMSHKQISDLLGRLIAAQETERTRLARDLHDDVSQRIAGLSIALSGLKRKLVDQPDNSDVMLALTAMQQNTIALAEDIREVSHALHPAILQHSGLVAALSSFCGEFNKVHSIAVTFSAGDDIGHVEADTALCLYRITQEAIHNVAKHAGARRVGVTLMRTPTGMQLSIADDGKGFDLASARGESTGLGLASIDERVRLLRGSVYIETQPGRGTRVQIHIPRPSDNPPPDHASKRVITLVNHQA